MTGNDADHGLPGANLSDNAGFDPFRRPFPEINFRVILCRPYRTLKSIAQIFFIIFSTVFTQGFQILLSEISIYTLYPHDSR